MKHSELKKIVLIGASTGGPGLIQKIITSVSSLNNATIIIAQHMAAEFIPSFVKRLQEYTPYPLSLADDNNRIEENHIYLCSANTSVKLNNSELIFLKNESSKYSYNPNINVLFKSFASINCKLDILCVILTGIGDDGVEGAKLLSQDGVKCLTESALSAIVDGMPSRAREEINGIIVMNFDEIKDTIVEFCK